MSSPQDTGPFLGYGYSRNRGKECTKKNDWKMEVTLLIKYHYFNAGRFQLCHKETMGVLLDKRIEVDWEPSDKQTALQEGNIWKIKPNKIWYALNN